MSEELKGSGPWVEGEGERHTEEHHRRRWKGGVLLWECDGCGKVAPWGKGWHRLGTQEAYDLLGPEGLAVSCGLAECDEKVREFYLRTNEMRQRAVMRVKGWQVVRQRDKLDAQTERELRGYLARRGRG